MYTFRLRLESWRANDCKSRRTSVTWGALMFKSWNRFRAFRWGTGVAIVSYGLGCTLSVVADFGDRTVTWSV